MNWDRVNRENRFWRAGTAVAAPATTPARVTRTATEQRITELLQDAHDLHRAGDTPGAVRAAASALGLLATLPASGLPARARQQVVSIALGALQPRGV